jgi:hypothetical protein
MRTMVRSFAIAAAGLLFALTAASQADDKNDKSDKKTKPSSLLVAVGTLEGEILYVDENGEKLTVRTKQLKQVLVNSGNTGVVGPLNRASVYGRLGAMNPNNVTVGVKEEMQDYKMDFAPDMKIRLMNTKSDNNKKDKSTAKKETTTKEKDPDSRLGGVAGKKESLAKGQMVRVQVGRSKDSLNQQNYAMVVYVLSEGK